MFIIGNIFVLNEVPLLTIFFFVIKVSYENLLSLKLNSLISKFEFMLNFNYFIAKNYFSLLTVMIFFNNKIKVVRRSANEREIFLNCDGSSK